MRLWADEALTRQDPPNGRGWPATQADRRRPRSSDPVGRDCLRAGVQALLRQLFRQPDDQLLCLRRDGLRL